MAIRKRFKKHNDTGVDMTPMLDIVFIMLIFFIITATFLNESGLDFTQPAAAGEGPPGPVPIQVYVDAGNNVTVEGSGVDIGTVQFAVESALANNPKAGVTLTAHYRADLNPIVQIKDDMEAIGRKTTLKIVGKN